MKKLILGLVLCLISIPTFGQSTSVTLNVADAGGQQWANGSYRITFLPNPQYPGATYTWTGGAFDPTTVYSGTLNGSGSATFSIPSNSAITPLGTNWSLSVCPFATSPCFQSTVSINGTTQTISPTPAAISINAAPGAVAYTDAEVKAGLGGLYYNSGMQLLRLCIVSSGGLCTSWVNVGGGGPGGVPRLDQVIDPNINKTFNLGTTTLAFINGTLDLSGLTSEAKLPVIAGCSTASNGQICYDSTLGNWIVYNSGNSVIPTLLTSGSYTTGDIAGISNAGGKITLTDLGPVNGTSGNSFVQVTTTSILNNDSICWQASTSSWVNCTAGVPVIVNSGTSYTVVCSTDRGEYFIFTAATAIAVTLPQSSSSGSCDANFFLRIRTLNADLTVTPTTSTINDGGGAAATLVIHPGASFLIAGDNTNYFAFGSPYREGSKPYQFEEGLDVFTTGGYDWQSPNNASPGTVLNKMVCDDGTGKLQTCAHGTSTTNNPVGSATNGINATPGTTGNTAVCFIGFCNIIFDATAVANNFAQLSSTVDGDLHDTGSSSRPTNGQPYWYIFSGCTGVGCTAVVRNLSPSELNATSNGGGKTSIQINGTGTQPITNFTTSGGVTISGANSGNTTTVTFSVSSGLSGMTAGQIPIAATGTTITSSTDLPDVKIIPAANCPNAVAGSGWSYAASTFTAACRAGSNNLGGALQLAPSTGGSAQFRFEIPKDWDSANQPYIRIEYGSGANTTGTVIWTVASACTKADGSITDDPAFVAESAFASQTMAAANRAWSQTGQFTAITSGNNAVGGGACVIKMTLSGTASSAINVYQAVVTTNRLITVQAN